MKKILCFIIVLFFASVTSAEEKPYAVLSNDNTVLTFYYDGQMETRNGMSVGPSYYFGWNNQREAIMTVVFDASFANCTSLTSTAYWFAGLSNLTTITGIENLKTDNVTDMSCMFRYCSNLTSLDINSFKTDNVTNMSAMFQRCSSLTSLDVSGFKTDNVTNMSNMFQYCSSLKSLDLSSFNTDNVTNMIAMFSGCSYLTTIYVGDGWSTKTVTEGSGMFSKCTQLIGGKGTKYDSSYTDHTYAHIDEGTSNPANPGYFSSVNQDPQPYAVLPYAALSNDNTVLTFYYDDQMVSRGGMSVGPFQNEDHSGWYRKHLAITTVVFDASFANCTSLTSTAYWFKYCQNLTTITGIENFNTENVTNMMEMFANCIGLTSLDLSGFKTDNVTNMSKMFSACSKLTSLDLSGFKTDNVTDMSGLFSYCTRLTSLDLSGFKTDNVTNMSEMFMYCSSLTNLDLSGFKTDNVTSMYCMFQSCSSPTSLDVSGFKTDNVIDMSYMFFDCSSLTNLDVSGFKTDNVTTMGSMFSGCSSLTSLDVSGFKTDNVTSMALMFFGCSSLRTLDLSSFKTDNVTEMGGMFSGCSNLTSLDMSGFKTGNVKYMSGMFRDCSSLTSLDLSGFEITEMRSMSEMFYGCSTLTAIYVGEGWSVKDVTEGTNMFKGCSKLVGGKGTTYDSSYTDVTYAQIDRGTSNPGYLSEKPTVVIIQNATREYGEINPDFKYATDATDLGGTPRISCEATATSPVGEYPIIVSEGSITRTGVTYVNGTLTITKAPLKVLVKSCSRRLGETNPTFELIYIGFKNGETEAVLTQQPTVTCAATTNSPLGTYPITISGGEASNYELSYENGMLTVIDEIIDNNIKIHINGQTAEVTKGNDEQEIIVPEKMTYNGTSYPVTSLADGAFAHLQNLKNVKVPASVKAAGNGLLTDCPHLAAIIWEAPMKMTQEMAGDVSNPNLLFYTSDAANVLDGVSNVINSQTKHAERIVLTDANDFYCPEEFTTNEISYTHSYSQRTKIGTCQGWETIVLPFDVIEITHETIGAITPFGALQRGSEYEEDNRPFWLYQYSSNGFVEADRIRANVPYLISMPNEARLGSEYILKGNVTFKGTNATVKATSTAKAVKSGNCSFTPNYEQENFTKAYLLNVNEDYDIYPEGSIFVKGLRKARPFEAYFELEGSAGVKPYFGVFEHLTDEIRSIEPATHKGNVEYYQLDGIKRSKLQRGFNIIRTPDGKTQKVAIK